MAPPGVSGKLTGNVNARLKPVADPEFARALYKAIGELPPRCRTCFIMWAWDDLTFQQIAAEITARGVPMDKATARRLVVRGLEYLMSQVPQRRVIPTRVRKSIGPRS